MTLLLVCQQERERLEAALRLKRVGDSLVLAKVQGWQRSPPCPHGAGRRPRRLQRPFCGA